MKKEDLAEGNLCKFTLKMKPLVILDGYNCKVIATYVMIYRIVGYVYNINWIGKP